MTVVWPSGIRQEYGALAAGRLLTVYEDEATSPTGSAFVEGGYRSPLPAAPVPSGAVRRTAGERFAPELQSGAGSGAGEALRLYVLVATWCAVCRSELPELQALRAHFREEELALVGLPGDPQEKPGTLAEYAREAQTPYTLETGLKAEDRQALDALLDGHDLPAGAFPVSILTDAEGAVLAVQAGTPTRSLVRRWLVERGAGER